MLSSYFPELTSCNKDCTQTVRIVVFDEETPFTISLMIYNDGIVAHIGKALFYLTPLDWYCTLRQTLELLGIEWYHIDITTDFLANHCLERILNLQLHWVRTEEMTVYTCKYILTRVLRGLPFPTLQRDKQVFMEDLEKDHIAMEVAATGLCDNAPDVMTDEEITM
jgi:hypothetical protein